MGKITSPLSSETNALREAYAALNRNDIPGFIQVFDSQIERIEPAVLPGEGRYSGIEAVKAHVALHRGNWAEGGCEPVRFVVTGDRIVAFVHVRVRLKDESEWREGDVVDVFTFRNGKAIQFRTFFDINEALEWTGLNAKDAN